MKVVVIGCGFAGLEVVRALRKRTKELDISMIDRRARFEYLAALPEILSGKVRPAGISAALNKYAAKIGAKFINQEVVSIDFTSKIVKTAGDAGDISYDYLVLSLGVEPTFLGIPHAEERSYSINTLEGALKTKEALDKLNCSKKVNVSVIGAGLTGVEVTGELVDYFNARGASARLSLVEMMPRVLPAFPCENLANYVQKILSKGGVEILTGTAVQEVGETAIIFSDGRKHPYDIIIWTAGVKPTALLPKLNLPGVKGCIKVDSFLRVPGREGVFAVGDTAYFLCDRGRSGQNVEEAEGQGKVAAVNILRTIKGERLKIYRPKNTVQNPGALISLGDNKAVIYFAGKIFTIGAYRLKKCVEHRYMSRFR
ncbi:MAG: FAD-dependent oxidoreductase [Halobacteriota archaeon]